MRSYHRNLSFMAALALMASACGGDDPTPPNENDAPVADFDADAACGTTSLTCTFTDASTDADGDDTIASWSWTIEGAPAPITDQSPEYTFPANGTYTVSLTVTDDEGAASAVATQDIVIAVPDANDPPTADFDFICNAFECTFTDASTDDSGIQSWNWNFDDASTDATEQHPVHTFPDAPLTTYSVTLTVTDDEGATAQVTKDVAVAPPAGTVCDDGGTFVECGLVLTNAASVRVTITSLDCTAEGNTLTITAPDPDEIVFTDGCSLTPGDFFDLNGGAQYTAGTELRAQMISGSNDPDRIAPQLRVTGDYPTWTLEFDDGEDPTGPGEPDFDDIVMTVQATE